MSERRVLVTAVGGDLGQALVKALRLADGVGEVAGCDMDAQAVGQALTDRFEQVPPASRPTDYVEALDRLTRTWELDAVLPASEPEIRLLGKDRTLPSGGRVVCQPADWTELYGDKLRCYDALTDQVELAPYCDGRDRDAVRGLVGETGFPVVVKSRRSSGARTLRVAKDAAELDRALEGTDDPVVQAHLDGADAEYSIGLFRCDSFEDAIAFRRRIGPGGASWTAERVDDGDVLDYAKRIMRVSGLDGSANVQVRRTAEGVRLLEVNPRFSSLVAARALCGFHDAAWSLDLALGRTPRPPDRPYRDLTFRRFVHEVVDLGDGPAAVPEWRPKEHDDLGGSRQ